MFHPASKAPITTAEPAVIEAMITQSVASPATIGSVEESQNLRAALTEMALVVAQFLKSHIKAT